VGPGGIFIDGRAMSRTNTLVVWQDPQDSVNVNQWSLDQSLQGLAFLDEVRPDLRHKVYYCCAVCLGRCSCRVVLQ